MLASDYREIEMSGDWFGCVPVATSLTSRRCSRKRSPNLLPVSPMYIFLHKLHVMQQITFVKVHVKSPKTESENNRPVAPGTVATTN